MALKFPTPHQVRTEKWADVNSALSGIGAPPIPMGRICQPLEAELNVELARRWARKHSPTGERIISFIKASVVPIHVIAWRGEGMDEGFSMFDSDSPIPNAGTVWVNLDVFVEVQQDVHSLGRNKMFNNFIVILHELGHAKQFIEQPSLFLRDKKEADLLPVEKAHLQLRSDFEKVIDLEAAARRRAGAKTLAARSAAQKALGMAPHVAYPDPIEWDNYKRHEGPICDEAGIMRRGFYANVSTRFPTVITS
jgi:hypothetical protein